MPKSNGTKNRVKIPLKLYYPMAGILVVGVVLSLSIFMLVRDWEDRNHQIEFESWALAYANHIENTLNEYIGALKFLGDFFNNSELVTREEFDGVVKSFLPRYPGIKALGWDPLIKDSERAYYESEARKAGFEKFQFTERNASNEIIRSAQRQEYVVVYYMYPLKGNEPAFGFDIASNETRLKAINQSFETGNLTSTGRITLVQETGNQFGVLLLQPLYKKDTPLNTPAERWKNRKGFVVEVLRIGEAIETALNGFSNEGLEVTIHDMSGTEGNRFLYHRPSKNSNANNPIGPAEELENPLNWSKTIAFGERQWRISIRPMDLYLYSSWSWQAPVLLITLLILTLFISYYMLRKTKHALEIEQRIKKQIRTNHQLENEIGERILAETERDKTIQHLKNTLEEVNALRGIVPLCSFCKKVRDDKGYWEQVDVYITKHSQADVSHGICPQCAKENYPDYFKDADKNKSKPTNG